MDLETVIRFGVVSTSSVYAITLGAHYGKPVTEFLSKHLVNVVFPESNINWALVSSIGTTLLIKEWADYAFHNIILRGWNPTDETLLDLKGCVSYLAGSGVAAVLGYYGLAAAGMYTASTAAAIVGTALSVHLVWSLFSQVAGVAVPTAAQAGLGAAIGVSLVAGKSLLGLVEVILDLTPAAARLTYSASAAVAALTLAIKNLAVIFFDNLFKRPGGEGYNPQKWILAGLRDVAVDISGSATAGVAAYTIVTAFELVNRPTAKLVIGATLITQMALKGLSKYYFPHNPTILKTT